MIKKSLVLATCIFSVLLIQAQDAKVIKFDQLQKVLSSKSDTTYVINFWATWCIPCVKEFPAFQTLAKKHKNEKVKVVMVSMDFKKEYEKTLKPYLAKHPIDASVWLLDEPDYNSWINKVDSTWGGEIPVTLIVNGSKKQHAFFDHDFTTETLEDTFSKTIKQ